MALFGTRKKQTFGQVPGMAPPVEQPMFGAPGQGMQQPEQQPAKFKPNILGVIGDAMQLFGGGQATYMQGVREQQERETGWQDWVRKQEYERANPNAPQPTEFERILEASGLPQEQRVQLMQDYARNRANPVHGVPYTDEAGNTGLQFIRPGQMQGVPSGLVPIGGVLPPKGGQTAIPSGNFPRR